MNPGSFSFGPIWWAVFIGIAALLVVATMCLFLWQASKEKAPRRAPSPASQRRELPTAETRRPHPIG